MSDEKKKYNEMSASEKKKEDWMNSKWRPMMGWMYMVVCVTDFVLFPILWSMIQSVHGAGEVGSQWQPITLQGAGLFHIAMGAILGITAYGRTQEKITGANNGGLQPNTPMQPMGRVGGHRTTYTTSSQPNYNTPTNNISSGFGGRAAPPPAYEPEI